MVIAGKGWRSYRQGMAARLIRLIAFVAVLLMPFGMAAAPAMSMPAAAASDGHCGEHQAPAEEPAAMPDHCASCSALPGMDSPAPASAPLPAAPRHITAATPFDGIEPETITPPPKAS